MRYKKNTLIVGTTRPETIFGDTAIAVHPDNQKFKHLIGKSAIIPILKRKFQLLPMIMLILKKDLEL